MSENIGEIENYFSKVGVAVFHATQEVKIGDKIVVKGSTTDFEMIIESMQIDRVDVETISAGTKVGLKVPERVRKGDLVYKA